MNINYYKIKFLWHKSAWDSLATCNSLNIGLHSTAIMSELKSKKGKEERGKITYETCRKSEVNLSQRGSQVNRHGWVSSEAVN